MLHRELAMSEEQTTYQQAERQAAIKNQITFFHSPPSDFLHTQDESTDDGLQGVLLAKITSQISLNLSSTPSHRGFAESEVSEVKLDAEIIIREPNYLKVVVVVILSTPVVFLLSLMSKISVIDILNVWPHWGQR